MPFIFILILIILVIFGPQWWAQYTFRRYSITLDRLQGTGGELARHLLDRFDMQDVKVEETTPLEPSSKDIKVYAPGDGIIIDESIERVPPFDLP